MSEIFNIIRQQGKKIKTTWRFHLITVCCMIFMSTKIKQGQQQQFELVCSNCSRQSIGFGLILHFFVNALTVVCVCMHMHMLACICVCLDKQGSRSFHGKGEGLETDLQVISELLILCELQSPVLFTARRTIIYSPHAGKHLAFAFLGDRVTLTLISSLLFLHKHTGTGFRTHTKYHVLSREV